jgi:hypothetical protein
MENFNEDYQDIFGNFELSQDEKIFLKSVWNI